MSRQTRCTWRRRGATVALAAIVPLGQALAHPLHTTMTDITCGTAGEVTVRIRTFTDDLQRALVPYGGTERAIHRYLADAVTLAQPGGAPVALSLSARSTQGDVTWLELRGAAAALRGYSMRNAMQFQLYHDQVNLVKVTCGPTTWSTLFSRGSAARRIP